MKTATPEKIDEIRQKVLSWHLDKPKLQGYNHVEAITEYLLNQEGLTMEMSCSQ